MGKRHIYYGKNWILFEQHMFYSIFVALIDTEKSRLEEVASAKGIRFGIFKEYQSEELNYSVAYCKVKNKYITNFIEMMIQLDKKFAITGSQESKKNYAEALASFARSIDKMLEEIGIESDCEEETKEEDNKTKAV